MTRGFAAGQLVLRLLVLLGPLVALLATGLVGVVPAGWLVALVAVLSVAFAAMPDSPFGTAVMLVVLAWWGISLRDGLHPEAVLAAAGLVTAHVAAVLASYGPGSMPLDRGVVRLWAARGAAVLLAAPTVWVVAALLRDQPEAPGIWVAGLAAACAATLVAAVAFPLDRRS
ncbi:MAG: hypothetical protein JWO76_3229 [Nocardioides sp.]|nr:hypothetical protein [Nocardioides sp.]